MLSYYESQGPNGSDPICFDYSLEMYHERSSSLLEVLTGPSYRGRGLMKIYLVRIEEIIYGGEEVNGWEDRIL